MQKYYVVLDMLSGGYYNSKQNTWMESIEEARFYSNVNEALSLIQQLSDSPSILRITEVWMNPNPPQQQQQSQY